MLRWATIASLVVLNISIWYGPLDTIRAHATGNLETPPTLTDAEVQANSGDLAGALSAYRAAVESAPEDPSARFAYALFCYLHVDFLRDTAHWPVDTIVATVRDGFHKARELAPRNYEVASQYALYLMDTRFFGTSVSLEQTRDAWDHVIALIEEHHASDPDWRFYSEHLCHALLQRARTATRFGDLASAARDLSRLQEISPGFRIPASLEVVHS